MQFAVKLTIGIIIAVTAGLIGYDIWAYANDVSNTYDTISGRMRIWGRQAAIIPYGWAVLAGHFWGPIQAETPIVTQPTGIVLLVSSGLAVLATGLVCKHFGVQIPMLVWLVPGIVAGAVMWPQ